jgi:hypothetical protein
MTKLLTLVAARKYLAAGLIAVRYRVFAGCPSGIGHVTQRSLATGTAGDEIRRSGTMRCFCILWMTSHFAGMVAAIEGATALVRAFERSGPFLDGCSTVRSNMGLTALFLLCPIAAQNVLLYLTTITRRRNSLLASSTGAVVAWSLAVMFSTRHQSSTDFTTAPAVLVVGVDTAASHGLLAAEAVLCGTHQATRRARTSMAGRTTGMWTLLGKKSWSTAGLATRERW